MPELKVGPILSYRNTEWSQTQRSWRVTALIGLADGDPPPDVVVENVQGARPLKLASVAGITLWRYDLTVALQATERRVLYSFHAIPREWEFTAPALGQDVRCAYVSCNGFSDPRAMRKLAYQAGAVWQDLLTNHDRRLHASAPIDKEQRWHLDQGHGTDVQRFHVLMMGGDQMYFDSIWEDNDELKEWADLARDAQLAYPVSEKLERDILHYYFETYCKRWLKPARGGWAHDTQERDCADAMARIPTIMMWDDHDIFDGWGSYTQEMQNSAVAQTLFQAARRAFWVYQLQQPLELLPPLTIDQEKYADDAPQFAPISWSKVLAGDPLALPLLDGQPGFSSSFNLGSCRALVLDLRTERSRNQILSEPTWQAIDRALQDMPEKPAPGSPRTTHLLVLSSVPVAHPKLSVAEALLDSFGSEHVIESNADDLKDHWSHDDHEPQRKRLTRLLLKYAGDKRFRTCIVSGDVHVAAWGNLYRADAGPDKNWLRIQQFTSSGVLHPAPSGPIEGLFVSLLNSASAKVQHIDTEHRCEMMLFPAHRKYMMAARNWLALELDSKPVDALPPRLWATWRCETSAGFSNHMVAIHPAPLPEAT